MATQSRRWNRKHLKKVFWVLVLLALISVSWHFMSPKPQTAWQTDKAPKPRTAWQTDKQTRLVGFAPNANILVTSHSWSAGPIRLWDVDTGKLRFALAQDWSDIREIKFSPDGRFLAALNGYEHLTVWDISTGEELLNRKFDGYWFGFRFCPDSKHSSFRVMGPRGPKLTSSTFGI